MTERFIQLLTLTFTFVLNVSLFSAIVSAQENTSETATLEINKPATNKFISLSEKQNYRVKLAAGQTVKVVVEQGEADLAAKIFDRDGKFLNRYDNEIRRGQNETIEFVADEDGDYRIQIEPKLKSRLGSYKIFLVEQRTANERDRAVFETRKLIEKSVELKNVDQFGEALPLAARALEIAEKISEESLIVRALNEIGETEIKRGNYKTALPPLERALSLSEKNLGKEHPQTLDSSFLIGTCYNRIRDYAKAERIFRELQSTYERQTDKDFIGMSKLAAEFGFLLNNLRDTVQAENMLKQAIEMTEKNIDAESLLMVDLLRSLGIGYGTRNDHKTAGQYFQKSLDILEKQGRTESLDYAKSSLNLGTVFVNTKEYKKSLEVYERALIIYEKINGKEYSENSILFNNIGNVYKSLGDYEKAMENFKRGLAIAENNFGPTHRSMFLLIANIAKIYAAKGDIPNAIAYQKLWDERFEKAISLELLIGSEKQKLAYSDLFPPRTSRSITLHLNVAKNNQEALDLGALVVLQRKGRVLDAVSAQQTTLRRRGTEKDRELLDRYYSTVENLSALANGKPPSMPLGEYKNKLVELETQKERIEREINFKSSVLGVQLPTVTLDAIKAEIPSDAALIEFAVYRPYDSKAENTEEGYGEPRYVAYVLRKNQPVTVLDLGDKQTIDRAIADLRTALRESARKDVKEIARAVDERVLMPVRPLLGDAKHLLISPDGELNLIPFESLVDEKRNYLLEKYSFSYLTTGRDLLRLKTERKSRSAAAVVANPSFSRSANFQLAQNGERAARRSVTTAENLSETYFAPLAGTVIEAQTIQKLFPDAALLTGEQATETALKAVTAPRLLHIATHGFFLKEKPGGENPLVRSGLALAGANRRELNPNEDDGILTAMEASGLDLWGTKLVVLSACDTGIGEVKNGEGVYGLRRAFTLAGTESLVMSLWAVSDYATRELMTDYYKNLKNGIGRGESLRQVKLSMMKKKGREHPFYWAGFIQSGEWGNLEGKR